MEFVKPCMEQETESKQRKAFRKLFPKPEPPKGQEGEYENMYKWYEDKIEETFGHEDEDDDGNILESTTGDEDFSSVGASEVVQSTSGEAPKPNATQEIKDNKGKVDDAIVEEDEDDI